jgi:hypothetical protein
MAARQGAKHHAAKMTTVKVRQARKSYATGKWTITALAEKYGVAHQTMYSILHHLTWANSGDGNYPKHSGSCASCQHREAREAERREAEAAEDA